jgi:hypothetical protein
MDPNFVFEVMNISGGYLAVLFCITEGSFNPGRKNWLLELMVA